MERQITTGSLESDLKKLGLSVGDTVLIRASLGAVGRMDRKAFIHALLNVVGENGTVVSLSFTTSTYFWRVSKFPPFTLETPSYAGALPNSMLRYPGALRSTHPQCSFVAIGKNAAYLTADHGPDSGAYEPVRKIIGLKGKVMLVGCVDSSPGFTTTHLAEIELGLSKRVIAPWLHKTRYIGPDGNVLVHNRHDPGLCSSSFWKFYAYYVRYGLLSTGFVGNAYSVCADAEECYKIDKTVLKENPRFNVCTSRDCVNCNLLRWDRFYMWPVFVLRRAIGLHRSVKK